VRRPTSWRCAIADRHGLLLIEDCAQAWLGTTAGGELLGRFGDISCFSLQQYKHISAGDGGLAITADPELAALMRLFMDKGWDRANGRVHDGRRAGWMAVGLGEGGCGGGEGEQDGEGCRTKRANRKGGLPGDPIYGPGRKYNFSLPAAATSYCPEPAAGRCHKWQLFRSRPLLIQLLSPRHCSARLGTT